MNYFHYFRSQCWTSSNLTFVENVFNSIIKLELWKFIVWVIRFHKPSLSLIILYKSDKLIQINRNSWKTFLHRNKIFKKFDHSIKLIVVKLKKKNKKKRSIKIDEPFSCQDATAGWTRNIFWIDKTFWTVTTFF